MSSAARYDPNDRLRGLAPHARALALRGQQALARSNPAHAVAPLDEAMSEYPAHPELLRLRGLCEHFHGRFDAATNGLQGRRGVARRRTHRQQSRRGTRAERQYRRGLAPIPPRHRSPTLIDAWFNLGRALDLRHDAAGALAAFDAVLELDPRHRPARILRAEAAKTLGRIVEAEDELRAVLREDPDSVAAWVALANLKSFSADADDLHGLRRLYSNPSLAPTQRIDIGFAFAGALEAAGDYARAFEVFSVANAAKRATLRWDARAVSALVDDILGAFPSADVLDSHRGSGLALLVGMPRSGSTLAEQIIAAHPSARAGGETGFVAEILQAESSRRGARFPHWVDKATDADWARLGKAYLARVDNAKGDATLFTDKTLTNWQTLGAIRRMLPGAHVVHCLRDPLETAWSCYKHNFSADQLYSYDFAELAAFFADSQRAMATWNERYPGWIHRHRHEDLLADPERITRALLSACGLSFDPACLRFHEAKGEVRTSSAAQVRAPLRADTSVAARYGSLLDPLRDALAARGIVVRTNDTTHGSPIDAR